MNKKGITHPDTKLFLEIFYRGLQALQMFSCVYLQMVEG